jgi:hypothetical protein
VRCEGVRPGFDMAVDEPHEVGWHMSMTNMGPLHLQWRTMRAALVSQMVPP